MSIVKGLSVTMCNDGQYSLHSVRRYTVSKSMVSYSHIAGLDVTAISRNYLKRA